MDISKAFDCIDHKKIFDKMKSSGCADLVIRWFKSYFNLLVPSVSGSMIILWWTTHRRVGRIGRQMQSCPSPLEMGAVVIWELERGLFSLTK